MSLEAFPKELRLKTGQTVTVRLLTEDDYEGLQAFFTALPLEDRTFFRHDVLDPDLLRKWTHEIDVKEVIPLVAVLEGEGIVGSGTLHFTQRGWMRHVGHLRIVIARPYRRAGLGTQMIKELVDLGESRGLEKVQMELITTNRPMLGMLERLGFTKAAELRGIAKDLRGDTHDLAIMINDVSHAHRMMEDWIMDSMVPAFRVPGGGH